MIIDFHTHVFPEKIAPTAISFLSEKSGTTAFSDGTVNGLLRSMEKAEISISVNMPVATSPSQVLQINKWCKSIQNEKIISFASYHPALNDLNLICEIRKNSFPGIKLHPEFQNFSPDDKTLDDLWKACIDNQLFVFFHSGADFAFSPPFKSDPAKFAKLHERHPDLKIILAHFGSWKMWDELENTIIKSDIYLETSFTNGFIEEDFFLELICKHGYKKIIFGSDNPWRDQKFEAQRFLSLPLKKHESEAILYKNASQILSLNKKEQI